MGKLQLGKLQHKVSFYRDAVTIDATNGEQIDEVQTIKENRWGSVKYIGSPSAGSSEEEINEQRTGKIKIEVVCRFFSGLKFEDWIQFEGGKFRIYSIQTLGRNEGYSLRAELRDDDTPALPTGAILDSTAQVPAATLTPLVDLTAEDIETLNHFRYDPIQDQLIADRAIETTLNSLFLGEQHKMSSGAENIFFTNLGTDINFYPMWGGLKDQSLTANQGPSGFIPPSGRIYTNLFSVPLGGDPDPLNSLPYSGPNYFAVNIAGLGITTVAAEQVPATQHLEYRLSVNGKQVYLQKLKTGNPIYVGNQIEWFFDHPVEIHAGTTIFAEIRKVVTATDTDMGQFMVQRGQTPNDDGSYQYQAIVHNRLFEDKDLEFISPFLKYQAIDVKLDATGASVMLSDISQAADEQFLQSHPVNTLEAVANGTNIKVKVKNGKKILIESMPVSGLTLNGSAANSVLNTALTQLNDLFTNTAGFGGSGAGVSGLTLSGTTLTLTMTTGTTHDVDLTTLGVDENNFVSSGALSGTTMILTMDDGSTVNINAAALGADEDTTVTSGTVSGNTMTLTMSDGSTVDVGVSALALNDNTTVTSGTVAGNNLTLTMSDSSTVVLDVTSLALNSNDFIASGAVSGNNLTLTLSDGTTVVIDVTTLATDLDTDTNTTVSSGAVSGTNLILTMSDSTVVTIDATSMVNQASVASLAPDVSNQTITVTENASINATIALDSGSDIVNMFGETDAPSWLVLNQSTGQFLGTAPAFVAGGANTYMVSCKAANVLGGVTNFTVAFVVEVQSYTNTKSLNFANGVSSYLGGNAAGVTSLERSGNGAGSGDAWSIGMWIKPTTNTSQGQVVFYYGSADSANGAHIEVRKTQSGGNNRIRLKYGTASNHVQLTTTNSSTVMPNNDWAHVLITYSGAQTGASSGDLNNYYAAFKIYVNGVSVGTSLAHSNFGWSGALSGQNYRWGRYFAGNYPRDVRYNQMCIWNSDQSANIAGIYNGGSTQNMTSAATMEGSTTGSYAAPAHYYEIESSVTAINDLNGSVALIGYNFSSSDLVTDAP